MKKRGQVFIIFAVILGILILSIVTVFNTAVRTGREGITEKKFNTICQNYKEETYRISQYAVNISNKNEEANLIFDFTKKFVIYAKKTDPNFQLIYVYGNDAKVFIYNSTGENKIIESPTNPLKIRISKNIIKEYTLTNNEKFWFVCLTEKEGEAYVYE